ncbi:MAG: hypothetical protein D6785_07480 [Planctomycetota bacterium]|nr:MAG: hypothetical protein D6785_07480 [Planctomycetota bacterium]
MFLLNKEKFVALASLIILALGIFGLIQQLEQLPKVPKMVNISEFEPINMDLEKVYQEVGRPLFLSSDWKPQAFLRDPWKEIGLWRIPPLEEINMPKEYSQNDFLVPFPFSPKGLPELPRWEKKP